MPSGNAASVRYRRHQRIGPFGNLTPFARTVMPAPSYAPSRVGSMQLLRQVAVQRGIPAHSGFQRQAIHGEVHVVGAIDRVGTDRTGWC